MSTPSNASLSCRDAGVDIDAGDAPVEAIKPFAKRTMRETVMRIGEIRERQQGEAQTIVV